ncbi:aftiphilin-like isoform X1 [Platichthys flesus]|uniref:aftiphilin-like isoform X1 n=1 Tax=Platichthys flesus TaxID=8260 RepID=UPI002DB55AAE|nr:aftiphilin-like isoform X1 [Platichthys flesus]
MEPFIMTLHSSSPPPLDEDGDGEAGTEDDEFGDFGGFCSPRGDADPTEPPSTLREPSHALKAATHPPSCSFHPPAEPSGSSGSEGDQMEAETKDCDAESSLHLTNGYAGGDHTAGTHGASSTFSPEEETGFADFTVFTEQAAQPWCCGLSPLNSTETWAEQTCDPGHEVVLDSEPRSHCASESKGNVCTKVEHCEERHAAQDPPQPQRAAAAFGFPSPRPHVREEGVGERGDRWRDARHCLNYVQTSEEPEDRDRSVSTVPQIISVCESASEDLDSVGEDFSFEGVSADLEPIVSSLASQDDQSDWDQTDAEDEELGNKWHSDSFGNSSRREADLSQTEAEQALGHCDQPATQETSSTSNQSQSVTYTGYGFADFDDRGSDCVQAADVSVESLGSLPPSDSFADFCSAPTQEAGEGSWAEFHDQKDEEEGSQRPDRASSLQSDGSTEEEQDRVGHCGASRRSSCQVSLSCRVQQILCASFPEVVVPTLDSEEEEEVLSLCAHLHTRHLPESEEEKKPELSGAQRVLRGLWWPHRDAHSAVGLHFQWSGSHTNRTLLRCLSVDTRNILFIGMKKQPVAVPAFASSLGMLEPTKDAEAAVCTSGYAAVTAREPAGPQNQQGPSTNSVQGALPSSQRDWSSRGLSSSQDGCCALNLDYFGPDEESRSRSRSSSSPPPGVDRDLYELTISKLETSTNSCHLVDTLNRLMSDAEKTSTSVSRKAPEDEELSAEAGRLIAGLPDLSFMTAKVLMFPSVLVPAL